MVGVKFCKAVAVSLVILASTAHAEVLFEGYARVFSKKTAIGYIISRYEFDAKTKKFSSTYLLKTETDGGGVTESLKAVADEKFHPVSYSYTSIVGTETKTIDAKFVGTKMTAQVKTAGKASTIRNTIPVDAFLSTFLSYVILSSPQGLKPQPPIGYKAIAEEDGQVVTSGRAIIGPEETYAGLKAFKIKNDFKGHFTSYVNARGEVLGTANDDMSISTELMADPAKATEGFTVNKTVLKALFGEVPEGKNNLLSKSATQKAVPAGKQQGVPEGPQVQIKPEAESK